MKILERSYLVGRILYKKAFPGSFWFPVFLMGDSLSTRTIQKYRETGYLKKQIILDLMMAKGLS